MAVTIFDQLRYNQGLGYDFTAGTAMWIILAAGAWTPGPGDAFVQTALSAGASEPAPSGDRQAITTPTVTLDTPNHRALWGAGNGSYPGVPNLAAFDTLVLYNFVTNDSDSWLMAAWPQGALAGDGNPITISVSGGYLFAW